MGRSSRIFDDAEGQMNEQLGAAKGVFGACMGVALVNDGPVTLVVEV